MKINTNPPEDLEHYLHEDEEFIASQGDWILSELDRRGEQEFKITHTCQSGDDMAWVERGVSVCDTCERSVPKEIRDLCDILNMGR